MTPRIAAYETLLRCEKEKQYSNITVSHTIEKYGFDKFDRDFYTKLVYGVIENKITLNYLIKHYTEKPLSKLDLSVIIIFQLSFYQIFFLDRIPNSAAVSEGVNLAARFASRAKGYVNAILRKACREQPIYPTEPQEKKSYVLSIKHSINEDIITLLSQQYPDQIDAILAGYDAIPTTCLQINSAFASPQAFIERYQLNAHPVYPLPFAVKLNETVSISDMPYLNNDQAFVQDIASQLTTLVLDPQPDDCVIDVCACPGGKTFSAANMMRSRAKNRPLRGKIIACDLHQSKLSLIERGAKRLHLQNIQVFCHDATRPHSEFHEIADRIICDVPCSGLGVINKKPEIRYKSIREINELTEIQSKILETASTYLKAGGTLVYSTCTLNRNENEYVVEKFLKNHSEFNSVDFELSGTHFSYSSSNGCLTLLPNELHDGFFIAKLQKK